MADRPLMGTFLAATPTDVILSVSPSSVPIRVPRASITRVEESLGRRRQTRRGLLIGSATGAAILVAIWAQEPAETGGAAGYLTIASVGVLAGGLAGAGIGTLVRTERWGPLSVAQLGVDLGPVRGRGVGLLCTCAW